MPADPVVVLFSVLVRRRVEIQDMRFAVQVVRRTVAVARIGSVLAVAEVVVAKVHVSLQEKR